MTNTSEPVILVVRRTRWAARGEEVGLIGRERERTELIEALGAARAGAGGLLLVAGEAGVGKTRLAERAFGETDLLVLRGDATQEAQTPYGPLVAALRSYLHREPRGLDNCGPLLAYLRVLLPELGSPARRGDRATLFEAIRSALTVIGRQQPAVVLLDDLQWADSTTLELLAPLAKALQEEPVLLVGVYRNDEIPRGHPLRRLRGELRRGGRLFELALEPLDFEGTRALAARALERAPARSLATALYDRTQGVPFFVEELLEALVVSGRLHPGRFGVELAGADELPIPETVRDAVLLRTHGLSEEARRLLETAAVAGMRSDLGLVTELAGESGLDELLESGFLLEPAPGQAAFRHALAREAVYGSIPWTQRRAIHGALAGRLEDRHAPPPLVAEHWLSAHDSARARPHLVAAFDDACVVHAHRDALRLGRRVLELWPEGEDPDARLDLLARLGDCAELSGELAEAVRVWSEVALERRARGNRPGFAEAERRRANAYALQGAHDRALEGRRAAAEAFAGCGRPADAAAELLATASHLDAAGRLTVALEHVAEAKTHAERAGRQDLVARALGIEGTARAKLGQIEEALRAARAGLALALEHDVDGAAIDAYLRLANVLENAAELPEATEAYAAAHELCELEGDGAAGSVCLVCIAYILLQTGEWDRCLALDREIIASSATPAGVRLAAKQHFAIVAALRGDARRARRLYNQTIGYAELHDRQRLLIWEPLCYGWIDELEGRTADALERCREIVARWTTIESRHYPLPALRWATTFLAVHGEEADARAAAEGIARLVSATVSREALATFAHALGEVALLDGDPEQASAHFVQALDLLSTLELPYETAQTRLRAGAAFAAAGDRETAVDFVTDAYRTARRLGARPLATRCALQLQEWGEPVEERLGRRAAGDVERGGLTRREIDVLRLVAVGRTNREVAGTLYLSPRTVDMHVRNLLAKLGCRSRTEAARRATELNLLA